MKQLIIDFANELYFLTLEMAPYLMLGFLIAGILYGFFPKAKVQKYLGKNDIRSVINAALLGIPLPLCSCGVIPTGVSFHQNGASKGAAVSFLISTPQTGVDSIMVTYSLLGLPFAIIRPIVAFVTGVFGGWYTNRLVKKNPVEEGTIHPITEDVVYASLWLRIKGMIKYAFVDFLQDIMKWLVIGLVIAAAISVALPDDFFTNYIGNDYLSILIVLAASVPLYVCATGSVPIAAVLLMKGLSPGAALVFLMAGPATNAATIAVLGKSLGKRALIAYLTSIIGGSILFGILINEFLPWSWFQVIDIHGAHNHGLPFWLKLSSTIVLTLLIMNGFIKKYFVKKKPQSCSCGTDNCTTTMEKTYVIKGMTCNHCKMSVETNLKKIDGIDIVSVNLENKTATVSGTNYSESEIKKIVDGLGFEFGGER